MNDITENYTRWFISWISIGNATGRILSGVLATVFSHLNLCYLVGCATIAAGIFTITTAFIGTNVVSVQISYCIVFGFCIGEFSLIENCSHVLY